MRSLAAIHGTGMGMQAHLDQLQVVTGEQGGEEVEDAVEGVALVKHASVLPVEDLCERLARRGHGDRVGHRCGDLEQLAEDLQHVGQGHVVRPALDCEQERFGAKLMC